MANEWSEYFLCCYAPPRPDFPFLLFSFVFIYPNGGGGWRVALHFGPYDTLPV